jgi:hypothetical protein
VSDAFLFLIYINDIVDDLDCNIKHFADDTSLYVIVDEQNYTQAADMLSTDLSLKSTFVSLFFYKGDPSQVHYMI